MMLRLVLACAVTVGVWILLPGSEVLGLSASDGDSEPVTATLQSQPFLGERDVVLVDGREVHASPPYINVADGGSTLAFSLDPRQDLTSDVRWQAAPLDTVGPKGIATAVWLTSAELPGTALPDEELESAARQVTIWSKTGFLRPSPESIPNPAMLRRVRELSVAAPDNADGLKQPASLALIQRIRHVDSNSVEVEVDVAADGETTFDSPQKIDVRIAGQWGVIQTAAASRLSTTNKGSLEVAPSGQTAPDRNTAYIHVRRPSKTSVVETHWNFTIQAGYLLVAQGGGPSVLTAAPFTVKRYDKLELDPDAFPDATGLLQRQATAISTHIPNWLFWVLVAIGLYLVPRYSRGVEWVGAHAMLLGKRSVSSLRRSRLRRRGRKGRAHQRRESSDHHEE